MKAFNYSIGIPASADDYVADIFWEANHWGEIRRLNDSLSLETFSAAGEVPLVALLEVLERIRVRFDELGKLEGERPDGESGRSLVYLSQFGAKTSSLQKGSFLQRQDRAASRVRFRPKTCCRT